MTGVHSRQTTSLLLLYYWNRITYKGGSRCRLSQTLARRCVPLIKQNSVLGRDSTFKCDMSSRLLPVLVYMDSANSIWLLFFIVAPRRLTFH